MAFLLNPACNFTIKPLVCFIKIHSVLFGRNKTIVAPMVAAQMITAAAAQPNNAPPASVSNEAMGSDNATVRIYVAPKTSKAVASCLFTKAFKLA